MNTKKNSGSRHYFSFYYMHKPGGFTKRLYQSYKALAEEGHHVHYFSIEKLPVDHANIHPEIIQLSAKPESKFFWPSYFVNVILSARQKAKEHSVEGYVVFSFFYGVLASFASVGTKQKKWVFIRADDLVDSRVKSFRWIRIKVHRLLEGLSIISASKIITTNQQLKKVLIARNGHRNKFDVLPNNIPRGLPQRNGSEKEGKNDFWEFVTVSVINPRKHQLLVLEALKALPNRNWRYRMIGEDVEKTGYKKSLMEYVHKHGLEENVEFCGWDDQPMTVVAECDLFIFPTLMEGSPNALLEAIGTGVACIASDIPEIKEVLVDQNALFSNAMSSELKQKLQRFVSDQSYRKQLSDIAYHAKQRYNFNWDQAFLEHIGALNSSQSIPTSLQ